MTNPNDVAQIKHLDSLLAGISDNIGGGASYEVFSAGVSGIVPAPTVNDADKFLRGDGTWSILTIGTTPSTAEGAFWLEDDV